MEGNSPYITNLVNSIIGVSVLAMPFCLKQCGIVLGLVLLFCAAGLTYLSCSMLASSAFHKRRRTYEYLALCTLGPTGKFAVELSMIGMMLGTCVAFYVVIGDLSNGILSKFIDGADPHTLRVFTIVFCALCIALPLGMMKNLAVLSYFGFFSLMFYLAFLVVVILNAVSNGLLRLEWWGEVNLFRPAGIFQCLPIFSLAYACQCQLFIVYSSLEDPSVRRIEDIVSGAIKFVTLVYMSVGFFGYTTYRENIAGNLLVSFPSNLLLDFIKLGFAMSVVLGFPLMISPCRQSIHTLFFAKPAAEGLQPQTYIPPFLFKSITLTIVLSTMTIAILIPNVETILGLTGATMGSIICFIFPALIYEKAAPKGPGAIPKFVFCLGCVLLVICTYSNLANTGRQSEPENPVVPMDQKPPEVNLHEIDKNPANVENENKEEGKEEEPDPVEDKDKPNNVAEFVDNEHRHEPANPIETDDDDAKEPGEVNQADEPLKKDDKEEVAAPDDKEVEKREENNNPEVHPPPSPKEAEKPAAVEENRAEKKDNLKPIESLEQKAEDKLPVEDPPGEKQKAVDPAPNILDKQPEESPRKDAGGKLPAGKESPQLPPGHISPKIIQKDENHGANPELKQPHHYVPRPGMSHKAVDVNVHQNDPVQQANPADAKDVADDSPEEKELLEKIKIHQDKQEQLLKEQAQLIKKLAEHQDKKEQAAEEKRDDALKSEEEVRAQRDILLPISDNIDPGKDSIDLALPKKEILGEFKGLDAKIEVPEGKVLAGDGILAGRELLSNQNENEVTMAESNFERKLDVVDKESEVAAFLPKDDNPLGMGLQKSVLHQLNPSHLEKKEAENPDGGLEPFVQEKGSKMDILEPKVGKDFSDQNLHRVERSLEDEDGFKMLEKTLEDSWNLENANQNQIQSEDGAEAKSLDTKIQELDGEAEDHGGGFQQDIERRVEDKNLVGSPGDSAKEEEGKENSEGANDADSKVMFQQLPDELSNKEELENKVDSALECSEGDSNCWQGKLKSRELKSLENGL